MLQQNYSNNDGTPIHTITVNKQHALTSDVSNTQAYYINIVKYVYDYFVKKSLHDEYIEKHLKQALKEAENLC